MLICSQKTLEIFIEHAWQVFVDKNIEILKYINNKHIKNIITYMFIPNTLRNTKINLQTLQNLDFELMQSNNDLETLQSFIIPLQ